MILHRLGTRCDRQVDKQMKGSTPSPRAREPSGLVSFPLPGSLKRERIFRVCSSIFDGLYTHSLHKPVCHSWSSGHLCGQ